MAWIESHQELARHPKTKKFARLLGVSLPTGVGHLHFFWWWAMDYAQDGDLSKYDSGDISDASEWDGDPEILLKALIESKFIDPDKKIHDWFDYAGRLVEKREQNKDRKRKSRTKTQNNEHGHADVTRDGRVTDTDVTGLPNPTQPNPTEPNPTEPNQTEPNPTTTEVVAVEFNPYRIYEQEGFGTISPVIKDQIDDLVKSYGDRWYLEAMKTSVIAGNRTMRYVNGILKRWKAKGIDEPWWEDKNGEQHKGSTQGVQLGGNTKESEFSFLDQQNRTGK